MSKEKRNPEPQRPEPRGVPPDVVPEQSSHPSAVTDVSHFPGASTTLPGTSLKDFHERIAHEEPHKQSADLSDESYGDDNEMEGMNEEDAVTNNDLDFIESSF